MAEKGDEGETTLSIGADEFQRLQTQLIELRTSNYQLKEHQAKLTTEISHLQDKLQTQARELDKANRTIHRSKKAKELQVLVEETEGLQRKLVGQESDFNLQSKTLMNELSRVCDENDQLKAQVIQLQADSLDAVDSGRRGERGGELTHLQAENAALQKSLQTLQEKIQQQAGLANCDEDGDMGSNARVLGLEVRLQTEEEEKELLSRRLEEVQESARRERAELQSEVEKWTEKARKKQDSFLQLQEEKEKQFLESRASFDAMVLTKDHAIQLVQERLHSLEAQSEAGAVSEEVARQVAALSNQREELKLKCSSLKEERETLCSERDKLQSLSEELATELHQSKAELGEERKAMADLRTQLEEAKLSQEQLADQVVRMSEEKYNILKDVESLQKLAEKRKALLDELSIKGQESATEQKRRQEDLHTEHQAQLKTLEQKLEWERERVCELSEVSAELAGLKGRVSQLEEESRAASARAEQLEGALSAERAGQEAELARLREECRERIETLEGEVESCRVEAEREGGRVHELELAVEEREEQVKIVERKSSNMLKDYKRQLQQMQKREDRLQDQMAELRGGQVREQMFSPTLPNREISHDSSHSRDSSLSSLRGIVSDSPSTASGGHVSLPSPTSSGLGPQSSLPEETKELVAKITELQQEKWQLEEKVHHLESTGSALADDVIQKSEIIKSYFMDTKADHSPAPRRSMADRMSPMRLVPWTRSREETLAEINRKMQRALEEALMKNIHLQENVDMLTTMMEKEATVPHPLISEPVGSHGDGQPSGTAVSEALGPASDSDS